MTVLKAAIDDLLNNRAISPAEAMDRHFAPDFRQRSNGRWEDRPAVVERISGLRESVRHAEVSVLDEYSSGHRYAERHVIDLSMRDGTHVRLEVYVFAERGPDGRFVRLDETTLSSPYER